MGFLADNRERMKLPPIDKELLMQIRKELLKEVKTPPGIPEEYKFEFYGADEVWISFDLGGGCGIVHYIGAFSFYGRKYGANKDEINLVDTRFLNWAERVKERVEFLSRATANPIKILRINDISNGWWNKTVMKEFD